MIGVMPKFYRSRYLKQVSKDDDRHPGEYLTDAASDEDKAEYEEYYNDEFSRRDYIRENPGILDPYCMWNGHIVERRDVPMLREFLKRR